jgi:hypothetical protein
LVFAAFASGAITVFGAFWLGQALVVVASGASGAVCICFAGGWCACFDAGNRFADEPSGTGVGALAATDLGTSYTKAFASTCAACLIAAKAETVALPGAGTCARKTCFTAFECIADFAFVLRSARETQFCAATCIDTVEACVALGLIGVLGGTNPPAFESRFVADIACLAVGVSVAATDADTTATGAGPAIGTGAGIGALLEA